MIINRVWAMPSAWTFTIKPISELLSRHIFGYCCDPYAGQNSPAQVKNDLNGQHEYCTDALDFLRSRKSEEFNTVLIDPPYSLRQVSEHYKRAGIKITGWHTSAGYNAALKDEVMRILKPNGKAICFGWNSAGIGMKRGFNMIEVLIVPHGGSKNDTICTVEIKEEYPRFI